LARIVRGHWGDETEAATSSSSWRCGERNLVDMQGCTVKNNDPTILGSWNFGSQVSAGGGTFSPEAQRGRQQLQLASGAKTL